MDLGKFILVLITALSMAVANLLIRAGVDKSGGQLGLTRASLLSVVTQPLYLVGLLLVGLAGILWIRVISTGPLSVIYPLFVSLTYLLIVFGAVIVFHENLSFSKMAGLCFVLVGMVLLTRR